MLESEDCMCLVGNTNERLPSLASKVIWRSQMENGNRKKKKQCDVRRMSGSREEQIQRVIHLQSAPEIASELSQGREQQRLFTQGAAGDGAHAKRVPGRAGQRAIVSGHSQARLQCHGENGKESGLAGSANLEILQP